MAARAGREAGCTRRVPPAARPAFAAVAAGLLSGLLAAAPVAAQTSPGQPPFRLFLAQGGDLVVRGDYVRVGDRVAFLLPLHADEAQRPSQLVTVPAAAVDWDTTRQYAAAVRAARHAAAGGYPAEEGVEIVALLDEAAGAGAAGDVSVSLVATTARPRPLPVLPDPSLQEIIARVLSAARLTPVPEERSAILRAALATLDDPHSALGAEWRAVNRAIAVRDLDAEARSALRLERDGALQRTAAVRAYHAGVQAALGRFAAARTALDDIRSLAGPSVAVLAGLERRLEDAADDLAGHAPPREVRPSHDLLRQAFRLAAGAVRQRFRAVQNADPRAAWDSAAAAAGALMLFDRAAAMLDRSPPQTGPN